MLELIDQSKHVRRFAYSLTAAFVAAVFIWRLPDIMAAFKQLQTAAAFG